MYDAIADIDRYFDYVNRFIESLAKVPKWRLIIAFSILGKDVSNRLKEIL